MLGADYTEVGGGQALGIYAKKDIKCFNPMSIGINPRNGEIALADPSGQRFLIFSPGQGNVIVHTCYQGSISEPSTKLRKPSGLTYNTEGHLAVTDEDACCVHIYTDMGREFAAAFGKPGAEPGQLVRPRGVEWLSETLLLVLDAGNVRVQLFDHQGTPLGTVGGSVTLSQPVDLSFYATGPLRGEDLWPRWFRRSRPREDLITELATSEHVTFLVRQEKDVGFEMLIKNRPGRVNPEREKEETWLDGFMITLRAGVFSTPPIMVVQPAGAAGPSAPEGGSVSESREGKEDEDVDDDEEEEEDGEEGGQGEKETMVVYSFPTLAQAVRCLSDLAECRWPEDGRRRALVAVLDRSRGRVQMYGHVASQGWSLAIGGHVTLSPHTFFTMNVFGDFSRPSGVCFDPFGNVIVSDTGHERIAIYRAETGLLLRAFPTAPAVRDLPYEYALTPASDVGDEGNADSDSRLNTPDINARPPSRGQSRPTTPLENDRESPTPSRPSSSSSSAAGSRPSSSQGHRRRKSLNNRRPSVARQPAPPPKDACPYVLAYNRCRRGLGSEGEGSFVVLINKELYVFKAARRIGAGSLSSMETAMFHTACAFLSYDEGRRMAGGARFLRDTAKTLRKEWGMWPFTPRALLGTKKLFIDWCRSPYGHKLRTLEPPQDPKAPLVHGRTLICKHWIKEARCPVFKLRGCPTKFYAPSDSEIEGPTKTGDADGPPCVEFGHGLSCAISRVFGFRYWYEREAILRPIFDRLAVERVLTWHSGRLTGDLKTIKHQEAAVKVLDYRGFLEFMTLLHEDTFGLRSFEKLPLFRNVDLEKMKRGTDEALNFVQKHQAMFEYQTKRVIDGARWVFE